MVGYQKKTLLIIAYVQLAFRQKKQLEKVWKYSLDAYSKYLKDQEKAKQPPSPLITTIIAEIKYDLAQPGAQKYLNTKITGTTSSNLRRLATRSTPSLANDAD